MRRFGILGFIENNAVIFFTNASPGFGMPHQLEGQRNLIAIIDCAALEAELAIIPLDLRGDADRTSVNPFAQGAEGFVPSVTKFSRLTRANW